MPNKNDHWPTNGIATIYSCISHGNRTITWHTKPFVHVSILLYALHLFPLSFSPLHTSPPCFSSTYIYLFPFYFSSTLPVSTSLMSQTMHFRYIHLNATNCTIRRSADEAANLNKEQLHYSFLFIFNCVLLLLILYRLFHILFYIHVSSSQRAIYPPFYRFFMGFLFL